MWILQTVKFFRKPLDIFFWNKYANIQKVPEAKCDLYRKLGQLELLNLKVSEQPLQMGNLFFVPLLIQLGIDKDILVQETFILMRYEF